MLDTSPSIIVASSGMLSGGPSQGYCRELVKHARDAVLLTGYQDEESPGHALLQLARSEGPREIRLGQTTVPVECQFGTYGLSAHADRMQMVAWIEAMQPRTVVLVHGDEAAKQTFSRSLQCPDVVCARNGLTLQRSYSRRRKKERRPAAAVPGVEELDVERARHLLGPAGGTPLRAATVAEAWFGQPVDRATTEKFARVLESSGLVRRDDSHRDRLWICGVQDTHLFPEEAQQEAKLKKANPKGTLLEFCTRQQIDPPRTEMRQQGAFFVARTLLDYLGKEFDSGPCQAAAKKTAEQLAAQRLLEMVGESEMGEQAVSVSAEDAEKLQARNPKGKLLEWCAQHKIPAPHFEQGASPGGYRVRAQLFQNRETPVVTPWFMAPKRKLAEQMAAESILGQLPEKPVPAAVESTEDAERLESPADSEESPGQLIPPESRSESTPAKSAAMAINELCQVGVLQGMGYEVLDQTGPSHQPTFAVVAWAATSDGRTIRTDPVQSASKKSGKRSAADRLYDLLVGAGITGR